MPPPLFPLKPGDRTPTSRGAWAALSQAGRAAIGRPALPTGPTSAGAGDPTVESPQTQILVRNDTGGGLAAFAVVKLGAPLIDNPHELRQTPICPGAAPSNYLDPFAVLIEPAPAGATVRAAVLGVVPVDVVFNSNSDGWAGPADGGLIMGTGTAALASSPDGGPAKIISKTGTGIDLAVNLDGSLTPDGYMTRLSDVGQAVIVTGGAGWTVGVYPITGLVGGPGSGWVVTGAPAAPATTDGAWYITGKRRCLVLLQGDMGAGGGAIPSSWKLPVRVATTEDADLATGFAAGSTHDEVELDTGDPILIRRQSNPTENGIYTVAASGPPTRRDDADVALKLLGACVAVSEGTANHDTVWLCAADAPIVLGTTPLHWELIGPRGFPAELTSDWNPVTGYAWKRLVLVGVVYVDATPAMTGTNAVTARANTGLNSGTKGWLVPATAPGGYGWLFIPDAKLGTDDPEAVEDLIVEIFGDTFDYGLTQIDVGGGVFVLGVNPGCGLTYGDDGELVVDLASLAGNRFLSSLVVVPAGEDEPCDSLGVDLDRVSSTTEELVVDVQLTRVGGSLVLSKTKQEFTNWFNRADLLIDRTSGVTTSTTQSVSICDAAACCDADPLEGVAGIVGSSSGAAPFSVGFTSGASGGVAPYTYAWDFGDGGTSTAQNPTHEFTGAGEYEVVVTITDACGNEVTDSVVITVTGGEINPCAQSECYQVDDGFGQTILPRTSPGTWGTAERSLTCLGDGSWSYVDTVLCITGSYAATGWDGTGCKTFVHDGSCAPFTTVSICAVACP